MANNDPLIGQILGNNFRLEHVLGRGGMAQVYYGRDINLQRPVAIKVIDARFRDNPSYASRFIKEAQAIATWRHENVVQIHYADDQAGLYFFVMEYIDGLDLGQLLKQYSNDGELMPHEDVIQIGKAVAGALDYAHEKGVIHRDVKPSNVMIATDNRVVLMDFGLAMDTEQRSIGEVFGTPHYIAPEQARHSADAVSQSDLYSLGVMLYEMLTGVVPFDDPSPTAVALQHLSKQPPSPRDLNPLLSPTMEAVLLKALSKTPDERYSTGFELMRALEESIGEPYSTENLPTLPIIPAQLSSETVADKLRLHQQHTPTTLAYSDAPPVQPNSYQPIPAPASRPSARQKSNRTPMILFIGVIMGIVLVVIGIAGGFLLTSGDDDGENDVALPTAIVTEQASEAAVAPTITEAILVPTEIFAPSNTAGVSSSTNPSPTSIPPSMTATLVPPTPTFTLIPPSATSVATTAPPTNPPEAVAAGPTVLYPEGRRFVFFYDNNGLYIYNASGSASPLDEFAFERLDTLDLPTDRLEGWRFAQYAPGRQISAGWCVKIEIIDASTYSTPAQCQGTNSRVTPMRGGSQDFWIVEEGSTQFRVVWDGQEVARCENNAGVCEAFLP